MGIYNVQDTKKRADVSKMIKLLSNCQWEQKLVGVAGNHTIVYTQGKKFKEEKCSLATELNGHGNQLLSFPP